MEGLQGDGVYHYPTTRFKLIPHRLHDLLQAPAGPAYHHPVGRQEALQRLRRLPLHHLQVLDAEEPLVSFDEPQGLAVPLYGVDLPVPGQEGALDGDGACACAYVVYDLVPP